jgi:signal transduction histidine kinase
MDAMRRLAVLGRRWVHLLLGGALLMPYFLLAQVVTEAAVGTATGAAGSLAAQLLMLLCTVPLVAVTGLAGPVRLLEGVAARELLGVTVSTAPARTAVDRLRTGAWCVAHLTLGGVVSALTLTLPPLIVLLATLPWHEHRLGTAVLPTGWSAAWGPPAAVAVLAGLVAVAAGTGALLARLAVALLGPSAADRLAGLRRQVREQAIRTRLARDLHDSLGHALSVISVQAGAGERRLDADPAFARTAFSAIQDAAATASAELDRAIGLLSSADADPHEPDLGDLDNLVRAVRDAGVPVSADITVGSVPVVVSRETYRVVQEALTNAVRHGGGSPVRLRVSTEGGDLLVEVANRAGTAGRHPGRGLRGMAERVAALGGELETGPVDGEWRVSLTVGVA